MTKSQVVNEWISRGEALGQLQERRRTLLESLTDRFPGKAAPDVIQLIQHQDSLELLRDWSRAANHAATFEEFLAEVKR